MNIFEDYFDLLKQLIRSPSVVGAEYPYFFTLKRELGRIISATKGAIQGTTLQIPTINYHTTNETARAKSITQAIKILRNLYLF
jgi:hypothetical protein